MSETTSAPPAPPESPAPATPPVAAAPRPGRWRAFLRYPAAVVLGVLVAVLASYLLRKIGF